MSHFQAQTIAQILTDEGYQAYTVTTCHVRGKAKIVHNAPAYVYTSVLALVGR